MAELKNRSETAEIKEDEMSDSSNADFRGASYAETEPQAQKNSKESEDFPWVKASELAEEIFFVKAEARTADRRLASWAEELLDLGKRNNLISFRDTKTLSVEVLSLSVLDVFEQLRREISLEVYDYQLDQEFLSDLQVMESEELEAFEQLIHRNERNEIRNFFSCRLQKPNQILLFSKSKSPFSALQNIRKKAKEYLEETGLHVVYMAFGFVYWKESESSEMEYRAPILLLPIKISRKSTITPWQIQCTEDEVVVNPTFSHKLEVEYGMTFPEFSMDEDLPGYLGKIAALAERLKWRVSSECKIGIFSFQKINMYRDLLDHSSMILTNENVRMLVGESVKEDSFTDQHTKEPLLDLCNVVEADSSQIQAIEMAKFGGSFVLQGPPGTGKSQTITNIIAECLNDGKKVLFVSEKQAALNVVYDKLKQVNLAEFCLELHSHKANKKSVIDELYNSLCGRWELNGNHSDSELLVKKRRKLQQLDLYVKELHERREPIGKSLYELFCIYESPDLRNVQESRGLIPEITLKDEMYLYETKELLEKFPRFVSVVGEDYRKNPWYGCQILEAGEETKFYFKQDLQKVLDFFKKYLAEVDEMTQAYGISCPTLASVERWHDFFQFAAEADLISPKLLRKEDFAEAEKILDEAKKAYAAITETSEEIWQIKEEIQKSDFEISGIEQNVSAIKRKQKRTVDEVKKLKEEIPALEAEIASIPTEIAQLENDVLSLNAEIKRLEKELKESRFNLSKKKEECAEIDAWRKNKTAIFNDKIKSVNGQSFGDLLEEKYQSGFSRFFSSEYRMLSQTIRECAKGGKKLTYQEEKEYMAIWARCQEKLAVRQKIQASINELEKAHREKESQKQKLESRRNEKLKLYSKKEENRQEKSKILQDKKTLCQQKCADFQTQKNELQEQLRVSQITQDRRQKSMEVLSGKTVLLEEQKAAFDEIQGRLKKYFGGSYAGFEKCGKRTIEQMEKLRGFFLDGMCFGRLEEFSVFDFANEKEKFHSWANRLARCLSLQTDGVKRIAEKFDSEILDVENLPKEQLLRKCEIWLDNFDGLDDWCRFQKWLAKIQKSGAESFLEEVRGTDTDLHLLPSIFEKRFYRQWIEAICRSSDILSSFCAEDQEKTVYEFSRNDKLHLLLNRRKIQEKLLQKRPSPDIRIPGHPATILCAEKERKARKKSIRKLISEIGSLVKELKPCFLMSPLSVSTFLPSITNYFDVVIFDEASQIFPQDAIGAVYRARQLIVVGDSKQMPPTNFFNTIAGGSDMDDDSSEEMGDLASVRDFESILDRCSAGLPQRQLTWHYRSRSERLIAFSNKNFYENRLITFPSPKTDSRGMGVSYFYAGGLFDRKSHTNQQEAELVVDLIYENFEKFPKRSLGVVAFSQKQQELIEHLLAKRREKREEDGGEDEKKRKEIEKFFSEDKKEPFFIKNLETVQGYERDTIIFSTAYGRDAAGNFLHRFGPLNNSGGERRLNVAVTRAKCSVQLVSSMRWSDIDLARSSAEGVRLLREYLNYAENGAEAMEDSFSAEVNESFDSDFECSVCDFLRENGFEAETQVGCSGFRIDIALKRSNSSNYVLAIECDGAMYHSSKNARDRDRLRQEVLEGMGWKFYRVWSTDWYRNRKNAEKRLLAAVDNALRQPESESVIEIEWPVKVETGIESAPEMLKEEESLAGESNVLVETRENGVTAEESLHEPADAIGEMKLSLERSEENRFDEHLEEIGDVKGVESRKNGNHEKFVETEAENEAGSEAELESQMESELPIDFELGTQSEFESMLESEAEPEGEPESELRVQAQVEPRGELESESEFESEFESKTEYQVEFEFSGTEGFLESANWDESDPLKFSEYQMADIEKLLEEYALQKDFQNFIHAILQIEAPLSRNWLLKRIVHPYFGQVRVTKEVKNKFKKLMGGCSRLGIVLQKDFLYLQDMQIQQFRLSNDGEAKREIPDISPEELAFGMMEIIQKERVYVKEELYKNLVQKCGYQKIGSNMREQLELAFILLEKENRISCDGSRISVK